MSSKLSGGIDGALAAAVGARKNHITWTSDLCFVTCVRRFPVLAERVVGVPRLDDLEHHRTLEENRSVHDLILVRKTRVNLVIQRTTQSGSLDLKAIGVEVQGRQMGPWKK